MLDVPQSLMENKEETLEYFKQMTDEMCWRVPNGGNNGVWAKAFGTDSGWTTSSNWDSTNKGMDFGSTDKTLGTGSIWYPAPGYLAPYSGVLYSMHSGGFYWACNPDDYYGHAFHFDYDGIVYPIDGYHRAQGLSVRCFKE